MKNKLGTIFMLLGTVLLLAALSLFVYNQKESRAAETAAAEVMPRVLEYIAGKEEAGEEQPLPNPYDPAMPVAEIDGYGYIGYLSVPALELELPVLAEWDYERLNIAPCRYTGSTKTDDLVLCAHNYDRHFGRLSGLSEGDEVYFTDMDGVTLRYTVAAVDILAPTAIEEMTAGDYDLTLFTCTYGGQSRVTVRCDADS